MTISRCRLLLSQKLGNPAESVVLYHFPFRTRVTGEVKLARKCCFDRNVQELSSDKLDATVAAQLQPHNWEIPFIT